MVPPEIFKKNDQYQNLAATLTVARVTWFCVLSLYSHPCVCMLFAHVYMCMCM